MPNLNPDPKMALNIKNPVAESLVRELAEATGESLTDAVIGALRYRLAAIRQPTNARSLHSQVAQLQQFVRELPNLDERDPHEIVPYDEFGLPT
jgi:antitoxin VapB